MKKNDEREGHHPVPAPSLEGGPVINGDALTDTLTPSGCLWLCETLRLPCPAPLPHEPDPKAQPRRDLR